MKAERGRLSLSLVCTLLVLSSGDTRAQDSVRVVNRSLIAFTVPEKDLLPENLAYDPATEAFFVGSTRKGKIVRVAADGTISDFVSPRQDGLWMVIGMKVDARRRHLWVASSGGGNLIGYGRESGRPAGVFQFDLKTGHLIRKWVLDAPGETHFFSDLVVTEEGDVYVTHMFDDAAVYRVGRGLGELQIFARPEAFTAPNGIAISTDGGELFVAHREGVSVFDIPTGERRQVETDGLDLGGIDGLYFHSDGLVAIHPARNQVRLYRLDESHTRALSAETLEWNHPMFRTPTTGVLVGHRLYYIANAQFGQVRNGMLPPLSELYEVVVLKVGLDSTPDR